jgi:hypothetical protein
MLPISAPAAPPSAAQRSAPRVRRRRTYAPSGEVGRHLAAAQRLQAQIAELQKELDAHRDWCLTHLQSRELTRVEDGSGFMALLKVRHRWTYSEATERDALALRTAQKWEQSQGIAIDDPTIYVSFTSTPPKS